MIDTFLLFFFYFEFRFVTNVVMIVVSGQQRSEWKAMGRSIVSLD